MRALCYNVRSFSHFSLSYRGYLQFPSATNSRNKSSLPANKVKPSKIAPLMSLHKPSYVKWGKMIILSYSIDRYEYDTAQIWPSRLRIRLIGVRYGYLGSDLMCACGWMTWLLQGKAFLKALAKHLRALTSHFFPLNLKRKPSSRLPLIEIFFSSHNSIQQRTETNK